MGNRKFWILLEMIYQGHKRVSKYFDGRIFHMSNGQKRQMIVSDVKDVDLDSYLFGYDAALCDVRNAILQVHNNNYDTTDCGESQENNDVDDPVYIHKPESVITGWDYSDLIEEAEDRIEERRAIYGSEHI